MIVITLPTSTTSEVKTRVREEVEQELMYNPNFNGDEYEMRDGAEYTFSCNDENEPQYVALSCRIGNILEEHAE